MNPADSSRTIPDAAGAARRPDDLPDNGDSSGVPPRPAPLPPDNSVPCKNCSLRYDPDDQTDPVYGGFVGPRYCGYCGAQEARIIAAELGAWS